jgi:hypothetical protein
MKISSAKIMKIIRTKAKNGENNESENKKTENEMAWRAGENEIISTAALRAARVCAAGMASKIMSENENKEKK